MFSRAAGVGVILPLTEKMEGKETWRRVEEGEGRQEEEKIR